MLGDSGDAKHTLTPLDHVNGLQMRLMRLKAQLSAPSHKLLFPNHTPPRTSLEDEIAEVERLLASAISAPVPGGVDPTLWLPDELLILLFLIVSFSDLWVFSRVCRRWRSLVKTASVSRRLREERWAAYARGDVIPRLVLPMHSSPTAFAISSNSEVYCGWPGTSCVRVYRQRDFRPVRTLHGHTDTVRAVAVGHKLVYTGSDDTTVRSWEDGRPLQTLSGHTMSVHSIAIGPDGTIYSGSADRTAKMWSSDGTCIRTLQGHGNTVSTVEVDADSGIYTVSAGQLRVWAAHGEALLYIFRGCVASIAIMHEGSLCVGATEVKIIQKSDAGLDWQSRRQIWSPSWDRVSSIACAPDGRLFFSCQWHRHRLYTVEPGESTPTLVLRDQCEVLRVIRAPNGQIFTYGFDGIRLW